MRLLRKVSAFTPPFPASRAHIKQKSACSYGLDGHWTDLEGRLKGDKGGSSLSVAPW